MIDKIIFLISSPLYVRDYERYGAEIFLKNGFEILFFNIAPFTHPILYKNATRKNIYSGDREIPNKKLNEMTHRLYYEEQDKLSQPMIDAVLAINSFTAAATSGGRFQDLSEFVPDLKNIVNV